MTRARPRFPGTGHAGRHPSSVTRWRARISGGHEMMKQLAALAATAALALTTPALAQAPNDAQIAHIAYTAGQIDVAAGRQALQRAHDARVRAFAQTMVRDHQAVNRQAVALVTRLHVTPAANPTSAALSS